MNAKADGAMEPVQGFFVTGDLVSIKERTFEGRQGTQKAYDLRLLVGEQVIRVGFRNSDALQLAVKGANKGDTVTVGVYPVLREVKRTPDSDPEAVLFYDGRSE